jgi:hypothetical protein
MLISALVTDLIAAGQGKLMIWITCIRKGIPGTSLTPHLVATVHQSKYRAQLLIFVVTWFPIV